MRTRFPTVAGSFYQSGPDALRREVEDCFRHRLGPGDLPTVNPGGPRRILGLVSPHAGYMYSGPVAAHCYHALALDGVPDVFILLGPNHTGLGTGVSMMSEGTWRTPLGEAHVDDELAGLISKRSSIVDVDDAAHRQEHSIEVQLPFIQYLYASPKIVPICFLLQDAATAQEVGTALADAIRDRNAVIVASTDMTHYEPQTQASIKDRKIIDAVVNLDAPAVAHAVDSYGISMCGPGPVMTAIYAAKALNVRRAELLAYNTSGDITGDRRSVVGYASLALEVT